MASEQVALVTVTAPGADVLPWATDGSRTVEAAAAAEWNRTARERWSALNRAVREALRRDDLQSPLASVVWQLQGRGVLHVHLVLHFGHGQQPAARAYVRELRRRARQYGFGYVDFRDRAGKAGKASVMARDRAAGYLSRYAVDGSQLQEAAELPREQRPARLVYVSNVLTAFTRCTMRNLRRVRYLHVLRTVPTHRVFSLARVGARPKWLLDPIEYGAVVSLARAP